MTRCGCGKLRVGYPRLKRLLEKRQTHLDKTRMIKCLILKACSLYFSFWTGGFIRSTTSKQGRLLIPLLADPFSRSRFSSAMITPQDIASSDGIAGLKLSKDGSLVVYTVGPQYKTAHYQTSVLWLAETSVENSARQITSGAAHNYSPSFHPNGSQIFFLSDRHKAGGLPQLYHFSLSATEDVAINPITALDNSCAVTSYSISPDGNFVAFTLQKQAPVAAENEPITVWRENQNYGTLNLVDLRDSTKRWVSTSPGIAVSLIY